MLRQIFIVGYVILRIYLICVLNYVCEGFNLDLSSAIIHRHPHRGAMFGFSVALHRDRGDSWLLVGAPKEQTSQPDVEKGGAVFRCSTAYPNHCQSIPFDRTGPSTIFYRGKPQFTEEKSNQWFGATVHSSKDSGIIVACAPRYVYYSSSLKRKDPVGTCWVAMPSFSAFREYAPCRTTSWGYHRQGSCQAGFSAAVSKDGKRLFIGAVGSWYWQGQVFSQSIFSKQLLSTNEAPEHDDDSYMGYSMAVGEFTGDDDSDVAVGMPRSNLTGKVLLLNSALQVVLNITGEQVGSYFGYAVATSDINGDGLADIVISAPLFSNFSLTYRSYETGRLYIIYQNKEHRFEEREVLDGFHSKGRFGLAITSAGDVDKDMYEDIAVGAPYGGDDGKGVVYIYHGSRNGIVKKPSQTIVPTDIEKISFSTFGFSLSGGIDLDNNEYPDLLIGAYESDSAIFLKSRPVVTVTASLKVDPDVINLDDRGCSLGDGSLVPCMVISVCLGFTGINVNADLAVLYETKLDALKETPRMYFLADENHSKQNVSVGLRKDSTYCKSIYGYIQTDVRDKLIPITVRVSYSLLDQEPNSHHLKPILNKNIPSVLTKEISIRKHCGMDNKCIPDLQVFLSLNVDQYFVGSKQKIELQVTIVNEQEDAFEATAYIHLPQDIDYINIEQKKSDLQTSCSGAQPDITGTNELVCDIGNPFPANETMKFTVLMAPSKSLFDLSDFIFIVNVNSTNEELEETLFDNQKEISLPVKVKVEVTLHGISNPKIISYNKSEVMPLDKINEMDAGPEVTHIYAFGNRGPSTIQEAEVNILWPTYTLYGKHLLYLMEQPEVRGKGRCQPVLDVNPLSLKKENENMEISASNSSVNIQNAKNVLDEDNRHLKRQQREDDENEDPYVREMFCGPTLCTRFYCTVYELAKDEQVFFVIRARLWKDTIDQLGYEDIQISSKLVTKVISLPYQVEASSIPYKVYKISTKLSSDESKIASKPVPLWIFIAAVSSGLLLLGLLALLLWKLGFFQRRRFQDEIESESLGKYEKNGYVWSAEDVML